MDIKRYIAESEKQYFVRIKSIVPIDDAAMDRIERALVKYQPLSFSRPKKTMIQRAPLDFPRAVQNAEVWIVDATFGLPISPSVAREDVRKALDAPETFVVVRDRNEAMEVETMRQNAIADIEEEAERRGLRPAPLLSTDPEYVEAQAVDADDLTGTAYNGALLGYLKQIEDERREAIYTPSAGSQLFNWMDMPDRRDQQPVQDGADYNADIPDAPRLVAPEPSRSARRIPDVMNLGNQLSDNQEISRVFHDKNGKRVVIRRKLGDA